MRLQIAIDTCDCERALEMVDKIHDIIDIVEVGTPLIIREGMRTVDMLHRKYPNLLILADAKIVDGGELECGYATRAGAGVVTVLALAADETITSVVKKAHGDNAKVLADLIGVPAEDIPSRAVRLRELNVDYIGVHTPCDVQDLGRTPLNDLKILLGAIPADMAAVAGGVNVSTIADYARLKPAIIIAGSALTSAPDVRKAVIDMKEAMKRG